VNKNMTKKSLKKINSEGYTLIELIITLFLITVTFSGIYALFAKSMESNNESRHEIIAGELLQEGIEIIKNKREKNELDVISSGEEGTVFAGIDDLSECNPQLDLNTADFSCGNLSMRYNKNTRRYEAGCSGDGCVGIEYKRSCSTNPVSDGLRVVCRIEWHSSLLGGDRAREATSFLSDWQE